MGFDVSYHPISEYEIKEWYEDKMEAMLRDMESGVEIVRKLAQAHQIEDFYIGKYVDTLSCLLKSDPGEVFDKTHGLGVAVIQGFFRTYFYTRGSAFSFLLDCHPKFTSYTKSWQEIISQSVRNPIENRILDNYSAGVFIPCEKIVVLLDDYQNEPRLKALLDENFSHGRIAVFLKALAYCRDHKLGLLEATEVIEPNPLNLEKSTSYSNLYNCDHDGLILYAEAAIEQIQQAMTQSQARQSTSKGFFRRLFGKD